MRIHNLTLWTDELCFTEGAIKMAIKRYTEARDDWNAKHPGEPMEVYETAIPALERALATFQAAMKD
jgi:hypothetical protein